MRQDPSITQTHTRAMAPTQVRFIPKVLKLREFETLTSENCKHETTAAPVTRRGHPLLFPSLRFPVIGMLIGFFFLMSRLFGQQPEEPRNEPNIIPAQFTQPAPQEITPVQFSQPATSGLVADPPTPVVRIQVRVPSHVAPSKDVTYKILVANTSQADAFRVLVRNPIPTGVGQIVKAEPKPEKAEVLPGSQLPKELVWNLGTMRAGEKREIELVLRPTTDAREIRNQAFVSFEHGQAVITKVDKPKLLVSKVAPKQAAQNEAIPVRVIVENKGLVPILNVRLTETVTKGFEFTPETEGEKGSAPEQRVWQIGTLRPGERKVIEYRLTTKNAADLLTTSAVDSPDSPEAERAESTTKVLVAGLTLELTGPTSAVGGEPALYEVVARNVGSLSLNDVRVSVSVPTDCTLSKMTNGGQRYRDQVVWNIPTLKPGEAQSQRVGVKANTTGRRTIRAAVRDGSGLERAREVITTFQGTAVLQWSAALEPTSLPTGRQGVLTVRVMNYGGESARNVRLRVELPPEVRLVQASPRNQAAANEAAFDAITIAPNSEEKFTLTFRAEKAGQSWFRMKLFAESLGDQPLAKEQSVEITRGQ